MLKRSEIEEKYKWDLTDYFSNDEDWKNQFENVKKLYDKLEKYEGLLNDDNKLLECLNLEKNASEITNRLYVYISLKVKEDGKNNYYQNLSNKLIKYLDEVSPKLSYISSEINEFSSERLIKLSKDKRFEDYDLMLKDAIRNKPHMLSKQEEKLLAMVGECIGGESEIFDMIDAVDIKFEDVTNSKGEKLPLNNANYSAYILSSDAKLRETAFKNLNGGYGKLNYTISTIYNNNLKKDSALAKVRNFNSSFEQSLFGEEVDKSVYETLVSQVNKNRGLFHTYFEHKRKALGLSVFHNYDVNAKLSVKNNQEYSYDKAFDIVCDALKVLGDDYIEVLKRAKKERWIDVLPNENKDTGAFSWGAYGAHPVVMLNHENTINSVFTLAHELGHMMHSYYSNNNLPSTKAGYEIFVAEVASTVNEMLLARKMLNNAKTNEEKLYYIDYLMNMFYSTVYRQTMFAEFEYNAHFAYENGDDTTTEALNKMYMDLCKKYFGENVELSDELKYEWSRIPHFYNSFYVYKYATGLISALAISNKILNGEKDAIKNYKEFLKSGSTKKPVELLKLAGADLTDEATFENAFSFVKKILDTIKKVLDESCTLNR